MLLGGESQAFSFPPEIAASFGAKLASLARDTGGSLLVTPSRRTRADSLAALTAAIKDLPHTVWDGTGENPYFAFLALADAIVVTEDSVNMVTEAAGTGKPVYVQALAGRSLAALPLPPSHAGAWRHAPLRRQARGLELRADQRHRSRRLDHQARARS